MLGVNWMLKLMGGENLQVLLDIFVGHFVVTHTTGHLSSVRKVMQLTI